MPGTSFAESYVLALKVRSKLTREAADPKTSLRLLVLQANMLDNLMDHIALETEKRRTPAPSKVSFELPEKKPASMQVVPSVTEYEIDSDSDLEDDYAVASSDSDSDDALYFSSSDEEDESDISVQVPHSASFRQLPLVNLGHHLNLLIIPEEEDDLPELTKLLLLSDSDSASDDDEAFRVAYPENAAKMSSEELLRQNSRVRHQRHNAMVDMVY